MTRESKCQRFQKEIDDDDVEILEVVGLDEDIPGSGIGQEEQVVLEEGFEPADRRRFDEAVLSSDARAVAGPDPETRPEPEDDALIRLRADYDNLCRRIERERQEYISLATSTLVGRLLPVMDNFQRALAMDPASGTKGMWREGLEMIYRQLSDELAQEGLKPIEAVGQSFDPSIHDAVATETNAEEPANTVIEEFQTGYLFRSRLLRPAMVKVSTGADDVGEDT